MPLPLIPVAGVALKYGAVALTAWAASRAISRATQPARVDQRTEDAFDALDEGLGLRSSPDRDHQQNLTARFHRKLRLGKAEWEVDAGLLARLRIKRI